MIHTQICTAPGIHPIGMVFFIAPILASLFIVGLFPLSVNLITDKDEGFGADDDSRFKKRILFILMALQFVPTFTALGLMVSEAGKVPLGQSKAFLVEQFISSLLFLSASLLLKFGNYQTQESDFF